MLITFIHSGKAFLPEIQAYTRFFSTRGFRTAEITNVAKINSETSLAWYFMGTDTGSLPAYCIKVHEYSSLSVPPFSKLKDWAKKQINSTPHYRIFLNNYIQKQLGFTDTIPFGFRDMGVDIYQGPAIPFTNKLYDFIYCGDVSPVRGIEGMLNVFTSPALSRHSLLVLSRNYEKLQQQYNKFTNITFAGPVSPSEVVRYLQQAKFAINFIPNKEPFNRQTSTKLLEYAAAGIPIISTRYEWVQQFQQQYGGHFFYLEPNWSNFTWENITLFNYQFPDLSSFRWEAQIEQSGLLTFLESKFESLQF